MSKVAVVYWSSTGNTQAMAEAVADGIRSAGGDAELKTASEFSADQISNYDAFAFGCPAMGAEVLEEGEFQPMWDSVKGSLSGKKTGLFGSWGWGGGAWMNDWEADAMGCGVNVVGTVTCNQTPDEAAVAECNDLGKKLV
ncbi:MAG: flavodoxin [Bulleidia sp.]|nr:flavodoxin [Bulleidia sp.]